MLSIQSQPSPIHIPLVHIPHPDSVAIFINYTPHEIWTAIETSKLQLQLNIIQVPGTKYSPLFFTTSSLRNGINYFLTIIQSSQTNQKPLALYVKPFRQLRYRQ